MKKLLLVFIVLSLGGVVKGGNSFSSRTSVFSATGGQKLLAVCYRPPDGITGYWSPMEKQIPDAGTALEGFLHWSRLQEEIDWDAYSRQVVGIEIGNRRLIFISYFPSDPRYEARERERRFSNFGPDSWEDTPYRISDGGSAFFRVVYDPATASYIWCEFNGGA